MVSKRLTCLMAVLLALTLVVSACTPATPETPVAPPQQTTPTPVEPAAPAEVVGTGLNDPNVNPAGVYPIFIEHVTFTIGTQQNATVTDYVDNRLTEYLEGVANATMEWEIFPTASNDALQAIAVRVAAAHPLPDVLMGFDFVPAAVLNYGQHGVFQNLAPHFEHLAPNWHERIPYTIAGAETITLNATSADGGRYFIPRINEELPAMFPHRMLINERMLHEIGWSDHDASLPWDKETMVTQYPRNTDELLEVLRAFRDLDPANNIPMIGSTTPQHDAVQWVMNAFVYNHTPTMADQVRLIQNDGVLNVAYVTDEWREGLRFLNQLHSENLLSDLGFTIEATDLHAIGAAGDRNRVGMALIGGQSAQWRDALSPDFSAGDDARVSEYRGMPPITGPTGLSHTVFQSTPLNPWWIITSSTDMVEGLFRLGDHQLSYETTMRSRYGPPVISWGYWEGSEIITENGFPVRTFIDDDIHERAWVTSQNIIWRFRNPGILLPYMAHSWRPAGNPNFWSSDGFTFNEEMLRRHMPIHNVPNLAPLYSVEEMERIQQIVPILETFVAEHTALFITGSLDVNNQAHWDTYLANLNSIGLPVYLEVSQNAFDRLMAAG